MGLGKQAKLYYSDGHFDIHESGDHVLCAVTGRRIPLDKLKYWSVERQEAYADAKIALDRQDGPGAGS